MRFIGVIFFVLLAVQVGVRVFGPVPTPDWVRVIIIVTAVGMISCLIVPPISDRLRRRRSAANPPAPPGAA
jgi:hypothetical protein